MVSQLGVILALFFSILIAIFALANNQPIAINYLAGKAEVSAVLVILGAAFMGALTIFLLGIYRQVKAALRLRTLQGELTGLRAYLQELEKEKDDLLLQLGQRQEAAGEESWTGQSTEPGGTGGKEKKSAAPDGPGEAQVEYAQKEEKGL